MGVKTRRTRNTSLISAVGFLFFSGVLMQATDNMDASQKEKGKPIRRSVSLCDGEREYVTMRKQIVLQALNKLQINSTLDSVPHITLLASGGGQRAAVSLLGTVYQMEKEALLNSLLYMGGVSGSTWSMASLYSDPLWSSKMDEVMSKLSGPGVELEQALAWLGQQSKEEHFSLTDIWGVFTSAGYMKQMDQRRLSEEASRNASNPYPIYCAIEKFCFSNGPLEGKWFEVTPHEAGFTELGVFVETSHLGSKFESGELLEKKQEMDMVKLQGVLGCALANGEKVRDFIPPWLDVPEKVNYAAHEYLHVYHSLNNLIALTKSTIKDPSHLAKLNELHTLLKDEVNHNVTLLESKTPEERKDFFEKWSLKLLKTVEIWSESLEDGEFKTHVSLLTKQILPLVMKWEWGTTSNFLYQYQDSSVPACLSSKEKFHLVDAGLLINVAYPPFLGDKRDIDLIIAPEYSAGDMFETLTLARDYAAKVKKPFPKIDDKILEEKDWPKDCYVFEGEGKEPTIIYMPLFNRKNCRDAEEIKAKMEEFSTFQLPFNLEKINFLLETAKANIKNNKEILLREIGKAAVRRQSRK